MSSNSSLELTPDHIQVRSFVWDTYAARLPMPNDTASVAVIDGGELRTTTQVELTPDRLLVTPFRTQNTPPPMSSYRLSLPSQPVHVSMSPAEDALAILYGTGLVQVWDLGTRLPEAGESRLRAGGKVAEPKLRWEQDLAPSSESIAKQVCLGGDGRVAALFWGDGPDGSVLRTADANEVGEIADAVLGVSDWVQWDAQIGWLVLDSDGMFRSGG